MSPTNFVYNPVKAYAIGMKAALDMSTEAQDVMLKTIRRAGQRSSSPVEWVTFEMPIVDPRSFLDSDMMRDTFHRMADQNLRGWEVAADMLKTLPTWVSMSTRAPGTVMTDWFDQMRRASESMMPANDAWATAPEPAPVVTKRTAPKAATTPAKITKPKPSDAPKAKPAKPRALKPQGPVLLEKPKGQADDLTQIKGIGEKLSTLLNTLGVYHFSQIASWTKADGEWIDEKLSFKGRVAREKWVQQAKALAKKAA